MAQIEEPLLESAPLARRMAPELCRRDPATGDSCAWDHGYWQYLRMLGIATTPQYHADFFLEALNTAAGRDRHVSVLISGAMDYSMLAHVLWACGQHDVSSEITVVDICDTPLFLNHWYAHRVGCHVRTFRSNILEYDAKAAYDVVCTHALLGEFPPSGRRELMAKWRQVLKPGGRAITVNRLRPGSGLNPISFSAQQAQALRETVLRHAGRLQERLEVEPEELARGAESYAMRRRIHPVSSREEIAALFEEAGFAIEHLSCKSIAAGAREPVSGPTIPSGAEYARIIARCP